MASASGGIYGGCINIFYKRLQLAYLFSLRKLDYSTHHCDGMAPLSPQLLTTAISYCLFKGSMIPLRLSSQL